MMSGHHTIGSDWPAKLTESLLSGELNPSVIDAEATLQGLASLLLESRFLDSAFADQPAGRTEVAQDQEHQSQSVEARYRALVEQIPAVVFMAYLDKGIGEAYVSPQIEAALGFSQSEWLEDPVRWYDQIYPDDKQ